MHRLFREGLETRLVNTNQQVHSFSIVGNKMAESREGDAITALGTFLIHRVVRRGDKCISYIYIDRKYILLDAVHQVLEDA